MRNTLETLHSTWATRYVVNEVTGCWEWQGARTEDGYGWLSMNWQRVRAHRVAWTMFVGEIPTSLDVLHRCDNPPCVNLEHLFLGTRADNNRDRHAKGRYKTLPRLARVWHCPRCMKELTAAENAKARQHGHCLKCDPLWEQLRASNLEGLTKREIATLVGISESSSRFRRIVAAVLKERSR